MDLMPGPQTENPFPKFWVELNKRRFISPKNYMSYKLFFDLTSMYVFDQVQRVQRVGFGLSLVPIIVEPDVNLGWSGS